MTTNKTITVKTSLGGDAYVFWRMAAREELGRPFTYEIDLLSADSQNKVTDLLGQTITVELGLPDDKTRYFNGYITRFSIVGSHGRNTIYHATARPWIWLLTRNANCRIFQNMKVPDIIKQVFRDHGFSDFDEILSEEYRSWEYVVQYRETDFNFVSRLMEQEGIYYYFKHESSKHILVLADSYSAHETVSDYEEIPYYPRGNAQLRERDHLDFWSVSQHIEPGTFVLNDFDFEKPNAGLQVKYSLPKPHDYSDYEFYDYPGEYITTAEGDVCSRIRLEELHARFELAEGQGNARGLTVGGLFALTDFPREDQNREYLIVSTNYELNSDEYETQTAAGSGDLCRCAITAIDSQTPFRTARTTRKPHISGPQTATVVGKAGEDIWTDKYGRVKLQFHWDREGKSDENSSCWVRVGQIWAGSNWGAIHIPRIGQEVIVDFLEGDPDRPIVTGRVYNASQMPPYELSTNQTQSGIKSRSSKAGNSNNFNEIRFEDKKGEEQLFMQAEKDHVVVVKNDETRSVGNNQSLSVGNDRTATVANNETLTVGVNQQETIGSNRTTAVSANDSLSVGSNSTETVSIAKAVTIGAAYQITVGAAMNESVGGLKAEEIGGAKTVNVGAASNENVGLNKSVNAGKNISNSAGQNISNSAKKDFTVGAEKKMTLTAGDDFSLGGKKKGVIEIADELTIKVGKAVIKLKKNGDITIDGKKITVNGSGDIVMKGKKIVQN